MATKNAVAKQETGGVPAEYEYDEEDVGAGFDNQTKDDYALPFFGVLQALSKQVESVDGAKAGMIINTVTNDLFAGQEGIPFIPCHTEHVVVEWVPRDAGGGFVGIHQLDSAEVDWCRQNCEFGEWKTEDGKHDMIETFYVYGIRPTSDGAGEAGVIAFSSTKIKKYKAWMTKARSIQIRNPKDGRRSTPPLFAHRYRLKTVKEKNNSGEFWNFDITFDGKNADECRLAKTDELFQMAKGTRQMIRDGKARAAHETQDGAGAGKGDGEAPF